ncbi:MAG: hypothetical protein AMXMBFR47_39460 [Planctomycetota bacterium]
MEMEPPECESNSRSPEPGFAAITLGVDGRIYCHDLTPELVDVLTALCPDEPALSQRRTAGEIVCRPEGAS